MKPEVWTIAGSDSCGGAGVQSDIKTFENLGVHGGTVITAITAQSMQKVAACHYLPQAMIRKQIETLPNPQAVKIGMLGNPEIVKAVLEFLRGYSGFSVLDPLLQSSSGNALHEGSREDYCRELKKLLPHVHLLTPNIFEAEQLLQRTITTHADIQQAAEDLLQAGVKNVLIKGGHGAGIFSQDYWTDGSDAFWLSSLRRHHDCHGTGCVVSSAIAASAALGYEIRDALVIAKMYVNRGMRLADGNCFAHQPSWPEDETDLPALTAQPQQDEAAPFRQDGLVCMGIYPVIDSSRWVQRLVQQGIRVIQLRIKDKTGAALEDEIRLAVKLSKQYGVKLFINDYWQLAILYGADGVHLGQEDLHDADVNAIRAAGLQLGISTHCHHEVARAHAVRPSYIACGPVFATTSKKMSFPPLGVTTLARWRRSLHYPLVAIGGIDMQNIDEVTATGADGFAMISAITHAEQPEDMLQQFLLKVDTHAIASA